MDGDRWDVMHLAWNLESLGAQLAYFDGGEYAKLVSKEDFDIHTHNAKLFGIYDGQGRNNEKRIREQAKTLIYAVVVWGWSTEIRYDS